MSPTYMHVMASGLAACTLCLPFNVHRLNVCTEDKLFMASTATIQDHDPKPTMHPHDANKTLKANPDKNRPQHLAKPLFLEL